MRSETFPKETKTQEKPSCLLEKRTFGDNRDLDDSVSPERFKTSPPAGWQEGRTPSPMVHRAFSVGGKKPGRTGLIPPCWGLNGRWGVRAGGCPQQRQGRRQEGEEAACPAFGALLVVQGRVAIAGRPLTVSPCARMRGENLRLERGQPSFLVRLPLLPPGGSCVGR